MLRIGDLLMLAHGGELFCEYGLELKDRCGPGPVMVVGYANDLIGYVPDPDEFDRGGYAATTVPLMCSSFPYATCRRDVGRRGPRDVGLAQPASVRPRSAPGPSWPWSFGNTVRDSCSGWATETPTASPDHYQAMLITEAAVFTSKLSKWDEQFEGLPPHQIAKHLSVLSWRFARWHPRRRTVWYSTSADALEKKLAAIACYESQFGPTPELLERFRAFAPTTGPRRRLRGRRSPSQPRPRWARGI